MGIQVNIGGTVYEAVSYSVSEDSSPTSSNDSTGSVGQITFTFMGIENPFLLDGKEVSLIDSRRGTTVGYVSRVSETDRGDVTVTCPSRLGRLNIYDVQAQPFNGTLQDAFRYYMGLAGQTTSILVDDQIADRPVTFPGWFGELWFHLKQLAAAQNCEVALVSNIILLRPLSTREAVDHRDTDRSRDYGGTSLARSVEVYYYDNQPITDAPVYPPGGWTSEVEVITVGAGETVDRVLELSSSLTSIQQPVMQTFVSQDYNATSVFTIVGDDGFPILPAQWSDAGGSLSIRINPDTNSLTVTLVGAVGIRSSKGEPISTYSIALGSDFTGNRYSTLRLVGTGVSYNKQRISVRTLVPDQLTSTEVGATIDNPFLSTLDDAYQAGVRAAKWYAGERMAINGNVTSINKRGESGEATYPTYEFDQGVHQGQTYGQVDIANAGLSYFDIEQSYYDLVRNNFENQVFGNAGGARVFDRKTHRWYRTRTVTIDSAAISFDAEDDLHYEDVELFSDGVTYAEDEEWFSGLTYSQRDKMGLHYYTLP